MISGGEVAAVAAAAESKFLIHGEIFIPFIDSCW